MVGVGAGSISLVAGATIVNRWFETNRGTVMGILTASNATGQLIFLPLFGLLITRAGWRAEVLFIAAVCAVLAPLALLILREHPSDMNLAMLGATAVVAAAALDRQPVRQHDCVALRDGLAHARFLAARRQLLHLRREHERPDRHAPRSRLRRSRDPRSASRRTLGGHGRVRFYRNDRVGLAVRPL
jgi:MFS family permease